MTGTNKNCVIVGASHAAAQLVISLRQMGWVGDITVIGDEKYLPYQRPPLSKAYLSGDKNINDILIRPAAAYEKAQVKFELGKRVESVDSENKSVTLSNGESIKFSKLVLTTGSNLRKLTIAGVELPGVFYLRTLNDVEKIRLVVKTAKKAVIIGGGYIGLEIAAALTGLGVEVTILEAMERVLERVTTPEISAFYTRVHTEEGVNIVTNAIASSIQGDTKVTQVRCKDGRVFAADLVIIGIGIIPAIELAESAKLKIDNGIVVDEFAQTSDPDILAAGDCTVHNNPVYNRQIRLESVQNAMGQAMVAAATICNKPVAYNALPWFWSDQYDIKLQIAGLSQGFDEVVLRGNMQHGRSFAAFYLKQSRLISVDCINRPLEFMISKQIITKNIEVDANLLADESIDPKQFLTP